jgi:hypothetical protein
VTEGLNKTLRPLINVIVIMISSSIEMLLLDSGTKRLQLYCIGAGMLLSGRTLAYMRKSLGLNPGTEKKKKKFYYIKKKKSQGSSKTVLLVLELTKFMTFKSEAF